MKPKTMILMAVAITCGLGASYMTSRLLAERATEEQQPQVKILVAKKNMDMGGTIKVPQEVFEEKSFIQGEEPKGAILVHQHDQLKGRVLKRSLRAGDFVTNDDLLDHSQAGISAVLPAGHRAVGLRVNIADIAGGFASLPHSRVDIITTVRRGGDKDSFSKVLLENVLVLACDQNQFRSENNQAMPGSVVTVALSPEDMLRLTMAKELGPLSLALRKFNDSGKAEVDKITVEQVLNGTSRREEEPNLVQEPSPPPAPVAQAPTEPVKVVQADPPGRLHRVRIVEGDRVRYQDFWLDDDDNVIQRPETPAPSVPPPPPPAPAPAVQQPAAAPAPPAPPAAAPPATGNKV
jgi:pilus assembly protein CpaB